MEDQQYLLKSRPFCRPQTFSSRATGCTSLLSYIGCSAVMSCPIPYCAKQCHVWPQIIYAVWQVVSYFTVLVVFGLSFDHKLTNQMSCEKIWDIMRQLISYQLQWYFSLLRHHFDVLQRGNHGSLVGTSCSKIALLNHLQEVYWKSGNVIDTSFYTMICWQ